MPTAAKKRRLTPLYTGRNSRADRGQSRH
jgi:hypothetical protein